MGNFFTRYKTSSDRVSFTTYSSVSRFYVVKDYLFHLIKYICKVASLLSVSVFGILQNSQSVQICIYMLRMKLLRKDHQIFSICPFLNFEEILGSNRKGIMAYRAP